MIPVSAYVHWRSRERIYVHAALANVRARLHIQRWRPNGCIDRDPNWYKHSLWQLAQHTRVGDGECAFRRLTCVCVYVCKNGHLIGKC
jgi:hypothetical protein